jgi:pimeloyl-ACP methyl ester carboxylesterase
VNSIYRSPAGEARILSWCTAMLDAWPVPHERTTISANQARTHLVTAGSGPTVVFVSGTNFSAAVSLPLASALVAAGHRVVLPDVPGQPGLSSGSRDLAGGRLSWYGAWLDEVIEKSCAGQVTVMGHSFGAAIALASHTPRTDKQVLLSPGGLTRLRLTPRLLAASAAWFLRPSPAHSAKLLRVMLAPEARPRPALVEWMTLVARDSRSSGAPGIVPLPATAVRRLVVTGEHDVFLPPRRLGPAARTRLGVPLRVMPGAGHLVVEERVGQVAALTQ